MTLVVWVFQSFMNYFINQNIPVSQYFFSFHNGEIWTQQTVTLLFRYLDTSKKIIIKISKTIRLFVVFFPIPREAVLSNFSGRVSRFPTRVLSFKDKPLLCTARQTVKFTIDSHSLQGIITILDKRKSNNSRVFTCCLLTVNWGFVRRL